jgi:hypothetical protein
VGDDFLRPTAKQLFLEVNPLLDESTAARALMEKEFLDTPEQLGRVGGPYRSKGNRRGI